MKSYRRNPPVQVTFRTTNENRTWGYSFLARDKKTFKSAKPLLCLDHYGPEKRAPSCYTIQS